MQVPCSCIDGDFRLHAEVIDPDNILLHDLSTWKASVGGFPVPETYELAVTSPMGDTTQVISHPVGSYVLGPRNFGHRWQDGVYVFSTKSCGITYSTSLLITPSLRCCIYRAVLHSPPSTRDRAMEALSLLEQAEIAVKLAKIEDAQNMLDLAKHYVSFYDCSSCN